MIRPMILGLILICGTIIPVIEFRYGWIKRLLDLSL